MLIDGGWELPLPKQPGPDMYSGRALYSDTKSIAALDIPMLVAVCQVEERRHVADHAFPGLHSQVDEAFAQFEKWGIAGREDRLSSTAPTSG